MNAKEETGMYSSELLMFIPNSVQYLKSNICLNIKH